MAVTELDNRAPLAPAIVVRFEEHVDRALRRQAEDDETSIAETIRSIVDWWANEAGLRY